MLEGVDWAPIDNLCSSKLEENFSEEEICKVVSDMGNLKSPRPDNMTGEFGKIIGTL